MNNNSNLSRKIYSITKLNSNNLSNTWVITFPSPSSWILSSRFWNMEIDNCSHHILLPQLEKTWHQILKSWRKIIRTMDICTNSLIIFVNIKILIFTSLNSLEMRNSMCESWQEDPFDLSFPLHYSLHPPTCYSLELLVMLVVHHFDSLKFLGILELLNVLRFPKFILDCLSRTSIIWSHKSCILAMLLDMSLTTSNIWLTCFDIVRCSSGLKLWYGLDMIYFELDAKTEISLYIYIYKLLGHVELVMNICHIKLANPWQNALYL